MSVVELINTILKTLPVGFGFRPTDEELVHHYLKPKILGMNSNLKLKILGMDSQVDTIPEVDVCKREPWELPDLSVIKTDDPDWFFFSPVDYKYSNGSRVNRQTETGYWKPTGQDRDIKSGTKKIGTKKSLVFHKGQGRAAVKTNWVIHQYSADIVAPPANRDYVLCRLMEKPDGNTVSDIPIPDEAVAGTGIHLNDPANNMPLGAGPSHHASNIASDIRNYEVEEMILDDPEIQGLLHEPTLRPLDYDLFPHKEQGRDLDLSSPIGFKNSCGSMQFQDGDDTEFADSLFVDPDEDPSGGLSGQRSSAVYSGRLSAHPQSPLKGAYVKGGGSSSGTDTEVLHVKYSQVRQASSLSGGLGSPKDCMPPPIVRLQSATSPLSSINQHKEKNKSSLHDDSRRFAASSVERLDNFVAQGVAPKSVKLAGNDSNNEMLLAKLVKLGCSIPKQEDNSVSVKAKDRAEYGSASDLLRSKNPITESKKDCEVTEKANPKLSLMTRWNEPVESDRKGSSNSPETASHEPSSTPDYLVNLLGGIILLVVLIAVVVLDITAKV